MWRGGLSKYGTFWLNLSWTLPAICQTKYYFSLLRNHSSSLLPSYQPLDISPFWNDCMHRLWKTESSTPMTSLNESTTFLSYAGNLAETSDGGGELQSPCAPRNVQNLNSNRDFCTPEGPIKSGSTHSSSAVATLPRNFFLLGKLD